MTVNWDQPSPPSGTRRPWDEVLREFAEQTGRPLWPVTRVTPTGNARRAGDASASAWDQIEAAS